MFWCAAGLVLLVLAVLLSLRVSKPKEERAMPSPGTHDQVYALLQALDSLCMAHGIEYVIAYGTLLGAVREQRIIEWDDDADVWMWPQHLAALQQVLSNESTLYLRRVDDLGLWKLCKRGTTYPFVDIFVVHPEQGRFVLHDPAARAFFKGLLPLESDFYPLQRYTLGALHLAGPRNADAVLRLQYGDYMTPQYTRPHLE